ncbi:dipeptidyl peptidase 2-like [Bradysia coprophila]|uniref:dipeptidyl peptidase 2-like n=1 Tax=Bradysia coprophila TaxID=38358 RepID=UPI00187DAD6B|nr:dipeptidyl peptidase 2-like [Bradysia coprophila]
MKAFIFLLSISSIFAYESPVYRQGDWNNRDKSAEPQSDQFYEGFFETRVDHFKPLNQTLTRFRYNVNANFFVTGGPLYIYIKDFRDNTTRVIEEGLVVDVSKDTRAAVMTFDMRFFGQNRPTSDASFENLELLTIEQTLADIAMFIRFIREYVGYDDYSTVILFGSGYGGSLAIWAKKRYPTLVTAGYASSGIVSLALYSFTPFDLLEYALMPNLEDTDCRDRLEQAYESLQELMDDGESDIIANRFNLCEPLDTNDPDDVASLYELSVRSLMNYMDTYHITGVRNFCLNMRAILADPLHSFARWIVHEYGDGSCFDHRFSALVERANDIEWDTYSTSTGQRQQYYLQCTQLGGFPVADRFTWIPQNVSLEYHLRKCNEIFGREFDENTLRSAVGTLMLEFQESIEDTLYTNGLIDPWRFFGRLFEEKGTSINIEYHSKSADLASLHLNDPYPLYEAKRQVDSVIREWSVRPTPPPEN